MDYFWASLLFLFGACVGSFLNVVIIRVPRGRSILFPSSRCSSCRSSIPLFFNIPLLGYFLARGRCGKCGASFSIRYAIVELLTGLVFLSLFSIYGWSQTFIVLSIFSSLLIAASVIDLDLKLIPDSINLGGLGFFLFLSLFVSESFLISPEGSWVDSTWIVEGVAQPFFVSLFGAAFGYSLLWLMSRSIYWLLGEEGLGMGDVKLMALVGAVLGLKAVVLSLCVGAIVGSLIGLVILLGLPKGQRRRYQIPFGPFLCVGAFVTVFQLDEYFWSLIIWG